MNGVCVTVKRPKTPPQIDETPYAYPRLSVLHALNLRRRLSGIPESTIAGNAAVSNTMSGAPSNDAANNRPTHALNLHKRLSGVMDSPLAWMAELHAASDDAMAALNASTDDAENNQP